MDRRGNSGRHRNAGSREVDQRLSLRLMIAGGASLLQRACPRCERRHPALLIELELQLKLEQRMLVLDAHRGAVLQDCRTPVLELALRVAG